MKSPCMSVISTMTALALLLVSCTIERTAVHATDHQVTIRTIRNAPADFSGKKVNLAAAFKGWQGNCTGRPPVSRSDWMIEDTTGCLYVHGPLPNGVQSTAPHGEKISVQGLIKLDREGLPYLELGQK